MSMVGIDGVYDNRMLFIAFADFSAQIDVATFKFMRQGLADVV